MSRPPIHRRTPSPRGVADPDPARARYFGPDFAVLVALAERLAREKHGIEIPPKGRGLARTLFEIPALLAHILGEHQSLYARESYIGFARLPDRLVRHARKLAYEPDPGVASRGLAAFTARDGLSGEIAEGFALQSTAKGEVKAQTYETLAPAMINGAWNAMRPADAQRATPVVISGGLLELPLVRRHGLERGAIVFVEGQGYAAVFEVEDPLDGLTSQCIRLRRLGGSASEDWGSVHTDWPGPGAAGFRIHLRAQVEARVFGWNANAALYPPKQIATPQTYPVTSDGVRYGYKLPPDPDPVTAALGSELFLSDAVETPEPGALAALVRPGGGEALSVIGAVDRSVLFQRGETIQVPDTSAPKESGGTGGVLDFLIFKELEYKPLNPIYAAEIGEKGLSFVTPTKTEIVESSIGGRVTAVSLASYPDGTTRSWNTGALFPLDATLLTGWEDTVEVTASVPNDTAFDATVALAADLSRMRPGRPLVLRHRITGEAVEASVESLIEPAAAGDLWTALLAVPLGIPGGWTKGAVELLGNVVRVSHGETKDEILGSSDGVTAQQSFELKGKPVTRVPGALGAEIALDLRVAGVLWDTTPDFHDADEAARVATAETDAEGRVSVHFGGDGRGAVPPAGKRNIEAAYRVGLGTIGNIEAGRLSRIKKASPLLDRVTNPLPIGGGADPAGADDIALQATRPVRIFDRAVSVADYADLALLFPGVARASARWLGTGGLEVVAADADGQAIADVEAFRAFMDLRRDTGLPMIVVAPQEVPIRLTLRVERDRAYLAETVRLTVEDALIGTGEAPGLFTFARRALSAPQSLSALYAHVLDSEGVTGVEATLFAVAPGTGIADILHATDRQWLSLRPADLTVIPVEPGTLVTDAGGGSA